MINLCITEEEYFEYYQNSCDPTFENYQFREIEESDFQFLENEDIVLDLPY